MRSISEQSDADLGGTWSVLVRQRRDHVKLDRLLDDVRATSGSDQDVALRRVARLVLPHAFAEEVVVWPEVRRCLPEGHALILLAEQEHQEINELWRRLEAERLTEPERRAVIDRLVALLREDVRDEEDTLLPRLQESVGVARLRRLGATWELVRRAAPTRPHPTVSRRTPGHVVGALPLTLLDRSRDRVDAAARWAPRPAALVGSAGHAIKGLSARVERLSPRRRREGSSTR